MIIETKRLILREMVMDDDQDMLRLHSNREVQQYTCEEVVTTIPGIHHVIEEKILEYKNHGFGRWIAILKDGKKFTGWAGLTYLAEFDDIDLGYRFLPEFWGMGIATEACHAILTYGFDKLKLARIIAIAMKENRASIRVMEKIGMKFYKYAPYLPGGEDAVWYWCDKVIFKRS